MHIWTSYVYDMPKVVHIEIEMRSGTDSICGTVFYFFKTLPMKVLKNLRIKVLKYLAMRVEEITNESHEEISIKSLEEFTNESPEDFFYNGGLN